MDTGDNVLVPNSLLITTSIILREDKEFNVPAPLYICCTEREKLRRRKYIRSYLVNVSLNYKNTFKHLFPYTSLSSDVVNKLECLCISLEIVFVDAHELCYP